MSRRLILPRISAKPLVKPALPGSKDKVPSVKRVSHRMSKKRTRVGIRPSSKRPNRSKRRLLHQEKRERSLLKPESAESSYKDGYELGKYEGGEILLEMATPQHMLLPEVSLQEVISAGVEMLKPLCYPLMEVQEVFAEMEQAVRLERPCAVIRLGDGELLALSQEKIYDSETVKQEGRFLSYAGVNPPDLHARDQIALAICHAQIVGVPMSRRKNFQPLLHPVLRSHGIDPRRLRLTSSTINYGLHTAGLLTQLLQGKRLLIIGNVAPELAQVLQENGFLVTGIISPVHGFADIERVMAEVRDAVFDLALVSAGIPAVVISYRIAAERGKVAIDFGHMADAIVKGEVKF
ncbi:GT-D fold domain-containing glycosyltransferase [Paenibacillus solisilvae]|uniref:GT-D fold domain-containing glycosyltransferase n=1 Tax=Paenibacillus solisilvae TaxID=2486751 RepID=A0ABW0VTT4_9BACL